jgi:FkbM family methyltransferase
LQGRIGIIQSDASTQVYDGDRTEQGWHACSSVSIRGLSRNCDHDLTNLFEGAAIVAVPKMPYKTNDVAAIRNDTLRPWQSRGGTDFVNSLVSDKVSPFRRFVAYLHKPWRQKKQSFQFRYLRWIPHAILPIRLPIDAWWFAEHDFIGAALLWEGFENAEYNLASCLVRPGMTVLDIGAHKGFYSLLFSRRVGYEGRVLSFEPSRRERLRLKLHLKVNFCRNVQVFDFALGQDEAQAQLFVVGGTETGLNSLRPPIESVETHQETVRIRALDTVLAEQNVNRLDFIKIDVEGAEYSVFSGAAHLLQGSPRPMILAEVSDVRSRAWGHTANDLLSLLEQHGFKWFAIGPHGKLVPVERQKSFYDDNFLAVPEEGFENIRGLV